MNGNTKWIFSLIALFILIATGLGGYAVARVDMVENKLTADYVQKKDYRRDISRVEAGITRLNDKMDENNRLLNDKIDKVLRGIK